MPAVLYIFVKHHSVSSVFVLVLEMEGIADVEAPCDSSGV
jgi:hypothetical protein